MDSGCTGLKVFWHAGSPGLHELVPEAMDAVRRKDGGEDAAPAEPEKDKFCSMTVCHGSRKIAHSKIMPMPWAKLSAKETEDPAAVPTCM